MRPMMMGWLAYAYARARRINEALSTVEDALQQVDHMTGRAWHAELYRLKGAFLLELSPDHAPFAEASFSQAIAVAREQQAKSWELRAATSLAMLWAAQGKRAEAREFLAPVYRWFSEGSETADLKKAKASLDS
jgi:predicted ATPase